MDKIYNHGKNEKQIYDRWEKSGAFQPKATGEPFTIIMPPPNANDPLHIGHARFVAIQDTLVRYHRIKGRATLWLPGADHAGIETQYVFEKRLKEKGKSRFDYPNKTLYKMIWDYVHANSDTVKLQLRKLGASCDWTRFKFTLDPDTVEIVLSTFKKLYDDGMVYRGDALVNYCTHCGTAFSNLEVEHKERVDPLYYVIYDLADSSEQLTVATVRPEPIFADTHLAVNPKDKKRNGLIGKFAINPITGEKMKIIGDDYVDPELGTGIVKLTPAHDYNDFEVAKKHGLPIVQAIGTDGKILENGGKYAGLYAKQARAAVVRDLSENNRIRKIDKKYKHNVSVCYRCKNVIEPLPLKQWFIKTEKLAKKALAAIKRKDIKFAAENYKKQAINWLSNIEDWNVSRQIVWGIQIPAWRCSECGEWTITSGMAPKKCGCGSTKLVRDKDTFDTWFSSGQWPFTTLRTTVRGDYERFYPTSVMVTAYDILFFWVLRMIMLGLYENGKKPFGEVLIYGLVRDENGLKISKSKGNVIDPIEMTEKYGADALRMGLTWGALVQNDISLSEDNIRGQRNFANKLWNVARYVSLEMKSSKASFSNLTDLEARHPKDIEIIKQFDEARQRIDSKMQKYKLSEAGEILYSFIWNSLASDYIESTKDRREEAQPTLEAILHDCLKLAHPFMPFVTEEIYQKLFARDKNDLLINQVWRD